MMFILVALASIFGAENLVYAESAPAFSMSRESENIARRLDPDFFQTVPAKVGAPEVRQVEAAISKGLRRTIKVHSILKKEKFSRSGSGTYWIRHKNDRGLFVLQQFFIQNGELAWTKPPYLDPENPNHLFADPSQDVLINGTPIVVSPIFDVPNITDNGALR